MNTTVRKIHNVRIWNRKTQQLQFVDVILDIGLIGLAKHLGDKGLHNKSRKSKIQGGLITATTVEKAQ